MEISPDSEHWTLVGDLSKNTQVATPAGIATTVAPADVRFIRVTMLKNSANRDLHVVQIRAYEDR